MSYFDVPERPLDPPEDTREIVCYCQICDAEIREGDDYYFIPGLGSCCEECIREARRSCAEVECPEYYGEED